jgi:hypothetical protein
LALDVTTKLPASLESIRAEAAKMLKAIDEQRAQTFVQQLANGHSDEMPCQVREDGPISYADRMAELDRFEKNLKDGLPPAVVARLTEE